MYKSGRVALAEKRETNEKMGVQQCCFIFPNNVSPNKWSIYSFFPCVSPSLLFISGGDGKARRFFTNEWVLGFC
jgi:hypothetical protein